MLKHTGCDSSIDIASHAIQSPKRIHGKTDMFNLS